MTPLFIKAYPEEFSCCKIAEFGLVLAYLRFGENGR